MSSSDLEYGSASAGVVAGILTFILLGWLPVYGWLSAGIVTGLIVRGSLRGLVAAIVAGAIVSGVLMALTILVSPSLLTTYTSYLGTNILVGDIVGKVQLAMSMQPIALVKDLAISAIVVPAIGGFIGGSVLSPRDRYEDEEETEEPQAPIEQPSEAQA